MDLNRIFSFLLGGIVARRTIEYHYNPFHKLLGQDLILYKEFEYSYVCNHITYDKININSKLDVYTLIKNNLINSLFDSKHILRVRLEHTSKNRYYYDNDDIINIVDRVLIRNTIDINPHDALIEIRQSRKECCIYVSNRDLIIITNNTVFNGSNLFLFVNA